ncbi:MAG: phenylalanine--tRNA ligase subunit beta [Firmicutes bacterium]|jgi:phenylalanyl-tRNA synthetase beta chain|nr:phenylalanine--tRNA ligase subunit beta [Bacillota bacterium]
MLVPLRWLRDYVEIHESPEDLADLLTMSGTKVEGIGQVGENLERIVAGRVVSLESHPSSDRLFVASLDIGRPDSSTVKVVTAATNLAVGDMVPLALPGGCLDDGTRIVEMEFSGVVSEGMLCSSRELGISQDASGILKLPSEILPGLDVVDALNLRDTVLELEITPNRPDCLCVLGIAREVAAVTGRTLVAPPVEVVETPRQASSMAVVEIADPDLCPRYGARIFTNVTVGPSPLWMQVRLRAAGQRPINNIVDITNYVMLEVNQPLHAFDYDLLPDHRIIVRRTVPGEVLTTLDGVERHLEPDMLVIAGPDRGLAVAGIMGGGETEITQSTRNVLLEGANFARTSIWRTSRDLKLRTEASSRFEKGIDPEAVPLALDRSAHLLRAMGSGEVASGIIDVYPGKTERTTISASIARINAHLGTSIGREIRDCLTRLGFEVEPGEGPMESGEFRVSVPSFRGDVREEADLAEEVARIWGFGNVPSTVPGGGMPGGRSASQELAARARDVLAAMGASECATFPFMSPHDLDRIGLPVDHPAREAVRIANPMVEEHALMRTTMIPSLLGAVQTNVNRRNRGVCLFELGRTYSPGAALREGRSPIRGEKPAVEREVLAIGMAGPMNHKQWYEGERGYDFFDLKGLIETLLDELGVFETIFARASRPWFHPGRAAAVVAGETEIGTLGQVHPDVAEAWGVPETTCIAELDFDAIRGAQRREARFAPIPRHPAVERDVAMVVGRETPASRIAGVMSRAGGDLVESIRLFDVYEGPPVEVGKRSLAFSITYRAQDRTLTDGEVNEVHERVREAVVRDFDAALR